MNMNKKKALVPGTKELGNDLVDGVAYFRWLQEIFCCVVWKLTLLCPAADGLEVLARMSRVEVDIWLRKIWIEPNLSKNSSVDCAHELLTNYVKAVG